MLPRSMLSSQYNTNLNDTKLFKTDHCHRYTCEFNITQYGEDSMTDLTQYSEKVEISRCLESDISSLCPGEARVGEGHPQPWLHCSPREQGSFFFIIITTMTAIMTIIMLMNRCCPSFHWHRRRHWGSRRRTLPLRLASTYLWWWW